MPRTHSLKAIPERARIAIGSARRLKPVFTDAVTSRPEQATMKPEQATKVPPSMTTSQPTDRLIRESIQHRTLDIPKPEKVVSHISGFSIKQFQKAIRTKPAQSSPEPGKKQVGLSGSSAEIGSTELIVAWRAFAQSMPHEERAMSQRMDQLEPKMIGRDEFEVLVENPTILEQMKCLAHRIVPYMREHFSRPSLEMRVSMRELSDEPLVLSKLDQIKLMRERSRAFERLEREFGLTL